MTTSTREERVIATGRELLEGIRTEQGSLLDRARWQASLLQWGMRSEETRTRLLRLVDVLPALGRPEEVVRHLREYFPRDEEGIPGPLRFAVRAGGLWKRAAGAATGFLAGRVARHFIAGRDREEVLEAVATLRADGMGATLDILGEEVHADSEADAYMRRYLALIDGLAEAGVEDPNLSLKGTSLVAHFEPAAPETTGERIRRRLRPILERAAARGVFVNLDIESHATRDAAVRAFCDLLDEEPFRRVARAGTVVQAYLRDAEAHLRQLLAWVRKRGTEITVRLVKGAYWDYEVAVAEARGWPVPVFTIKENADACFERLLAILLEHADIARTAVASHNARSIACAIALAEQIGVPQDRYEFQALYGMGMPIARALAARGLPVRVYVPFGELIPGMGYLVRRLLENTANESFLRVGLDARADPEVVLRRPEPAPAEPSRPPAPMPPFRNTPTADFSRAEAIAAMRAGIRRLRERLPLRVLPRIGGEAIETSRAARSTNPADPGEVIAEVALAGRDEVEPAIRAAESGLRAWRGRPAAERAEVLFRAASLLERRRHDLAALVVLEAGKGWYEADADVVEAIDFLNYYACEALRLAGRIPLPSPRGEENAYEYRPIGIVASIAPWNFPAAIFTGMTAAALAAGNAVIAKPAGPTPAVAGEIVAALLDAGLPAGALGFLPGPGAEVGEALVRHPRVRGIAFTGSREVGLRILRLAAADPGEGPKRTILELGGKNAIIVAADADLDEAVGGIIASAFGYQGQKCSAASRVIAEDGIHDALAGRLVEAARSLAMGPPEDPGFDFGPVITAEAGDRIRQAIARGKAEAELLYEGETPDGPGHFVAPAIFGDVAPDAFLAQEEIFGPVLALLRAPDLEEAIRILNGTYYALTGGIYSRSPRDIERAKAACEVGNFYVNRKITGAIVARQPFGGFKMSGIGSKAGGPDYLRQFLHPVTLCENTMRRGFAPARPPDAAGPAPA